MIRPHPPATVLAVAVVALAGASPTAAQTTEACVAPGASLRLDHVPVAVGDLDALARRLTDEFGFTVQDRTREQDGLETAAIPFGDGTRLELRTVGASGDPNPADDPVPSGSGEAMRYAELIADGGGGAYLALAGPDLAELLATAADIEPDLAAAEPGAEGRAGFPRDHPLHPVFFVADAPASAETSETPERMTPEHANGAQGLQAVWVMVEDPERLTRFLLAFGARDCGVSRHPEHLYGHAVGIRGGTVYVVDALLWLADPGSPPVVSLTVRGDAGSVADNIILGNAGGLWIELRPPADATDPPSKER